MKRTGTVLAVCVAVLLILAVKMFGFLPVSAVLPVAAEESTAEENDAPTVPAMTARQVARDAQRSGLSSQVTELDAELVDRQVTYHQRLEALSTLIVTSEEQLTLLQKEESVLQQRIDQLLGAQTQHAANGQTRRRQQHNPNQFDVQQLKVQLDEGNVDLQETLAHLDDEKR